MPRNVIIIINVFAAESIVVDLFDARLEYTQGRLDEHTSAADPMTQFHAWFEAYQQSEPHEVNTMTIASVDSHGQPWQRVVLLKAYDENGFIFFTNYQSNKGQHFAENPRAALHFFWGEQERQVQVQGLISKISRAETATYFHSRPRDSQLGAWASQQSQPIADRETLEANFAAVKARYESEDVVPVPDHWGGYRITPSRLEFWQGGAARLHDRVEYQQQENGDWVKTRLNP
ncbi:MAG: pyridoxamine 5'-phosphate oxidase [Oleibacter sp.]|nr:pyridoxamine 5'-phosphate oxidase [Thalassolituus sp.]